VHRRPRQALRLQVVLVGLRLRVVATVVRLQVADSVGLRPINLEAPPRGEGVKVLVVHRQAKAVTVVRLQVAGTMVRRPAVTAARRKVVPPANRKDQEATAVRRRKISISR
jgi:hypothetical protein